MYRFSALRFQVSAAFASAVLLLPLAASGAGDVRWCTCTQPIGCGCGQGYSGVPLDGAPMTPDPMQQPMPQAPMADPGLNLTQQFGGGGQFFTTTNTGYIDTAVPFTHFRLRYDNANDNPFPDRAEFFYAMCGILGGPGPNDLETGVDYQEIRPYFEYAWSNRFSAFIETPIRFIDPEVNPNESGFGDLETGVKYALRACPNWDYLTFQFKVYVPTGDAREGLGTDHVSLEPGLLWFHRLTDRMILEGEVRGWIPIGGSEFNGDDFAGEVLRYGLGVGYDLYQGHNRCCQPTRLTAVTEMVAWTILDGQGLNGNTGAVFDASGDTIVNLKLGARFTSGPKSLYAGYGRALSGDVWYEDIVRLEYRYGY